MVCIRRSSVSRNIPRVVHHALAIVIAACLTSNVVHAQVGHLPTKSPYEDHKPTQDLTLSIGTVRTGSEPAGVGLKPGLLTQLRYDVSIGGPAVLAASYGLLRSERDVLNPIRITGQRVVGTANTTTHLLDVGLNVALTGKKTWHRLIPSIAGGFGIASDFAKADTGNYLFGTKFSFNFGGNVRYVAKNGMTVRVTATDFIWPYTYPSSYLLNSADNTAVLKTSKRTSYAGNWAFLLGASYPIFR